MVEKFSIAEDGVSIVTTSGEGSANGSGILRFRNDKNAGFVAPRIAAVNLTIFFLERCWLMPSSNDPSLRPQHCPPRSSSEETYSAEFE